jgi:hypothetical protein
MVSEFELFKEYVYMKNKRLNVDREVNVSHLQMCVIPGEAWDCAGEVT